MTKRLRSKNAIVTGGSRGIGAGICRQLVNAGWRVNNFDRLEPEVPIAGVEWVKVDLADEQALTAALEVARSNGPVLGLVNNAGVMLLDRIENLELADLDRTYAVNIRAPAQCVHHVVKDMKSQGFGRIVNITSRAMQGKSDRTAYAGSKGALGTMTAVWALELAPFGVTCNAVAPGAVQTELFDKGNPPGSSRRRDLEQSIPVGRLGTPEDIAHAVAFFMQEESGFITGQNLFVCGGGVLALAGAVSGSDDAASKPELALTS